MILCRFNKTMMAKSFLTLLILCLTSCMDPSTSKNEINRCLTNFSDDEVALFKKVGFHNYSRIKKWNRNISVSITGDGIQDNDEIMVKTLLKELSSLISPLKIAMIKSGPADITVLFSSKNHPFYRYGSSRPRFEWLNSNTFKKATVTIHPIASGVFRRYVIYHEMMHAIGFNHPKFINEPFKFFNSRIQFLNFEGDLSDHDAFVEQHSKYSALDKKMIRLLYSPCLPVGYTLQEFNNISQQNND